MGQADAPITGSLRALYEKCNYLRARSVSLRREARELCTMSHSLRETNAMLACDMRLIKSVGFFNPPYKKNATNPPPQSAPPSEES